MNSRFVLVEPSHPGNIGAAARAIRVMGFGELALVRPRRFPHAEATAMAAGADDVLAAARVCETLEEAVADCHLVFGTSARRRTLAWPQCDAREAGATVAARDGRAGFVFGRERSGLTNEELDLCQSMLHVATAADYGSLNLAQAVQLVAYECRMADGAPSSEAPAGSPEDSAPAHADLQRFYDHLERTLVDIGFLDRGNPRQLMRRLRRYFSRNGPSMLELSIFRGILTAAQHPKSHTNTGRRLRGADPHSRSPEGDATIADSDGRE